MVTILPEITQMPDLNEFVSNGLGVAAFENDIMVGFLCCYSPWKDAFGSTAKGTFSPIHAHGAIKENRGMIYKKLYEAAAKKWVENKITYHAIGLYAHDCEAIGALFTYGFGLRCADAIRPMEKLNTTGCNDILFEELEKSDVIQIRGMRQMLSAHMGNSPCFMYSSLQDFQNWIARAETRDSRIFVAKSGKQQVAYIEIAEGGAENFATKASDMRNICGAFCLPEFRGKGIYQDLLDYTIAILGKEGYIRLGVDFESFNPTANGFWTKYFTSYTNSVVRRIDECALNKQ